MPEMPLTCGSVENSVSDEGRGIETVSRSETKRFSWMDLAVIFLGHNVDLFHFEMIVWD